MSVSPDIADIIIARYQRDLVGIEDIAREFRKTGATVRRVLVDGGVKIRARGHRAYSDRLRASSPRGVAIVSGATRYFTGIPCRHGHVAERSTVNGQCTECARLKRHTDDFRKFSRDRNIQQFSKNPEAIRKSKKLSQQRRKAKARTGSFTTVDFDKLINLSGDRCHLCRKKFTKNNPPTIDHVIPLALGGAHDASNIALAHLVCNSRKSSHRTHLL